MVYEVDFPIKVNSAFYTIHKAFIFAESVSECHFEAEQIKDSLFQNKHNPVHIFIQA